jgi:hypothetical protein
MRICSHLTCAEPATVWYKHPYCGRHALERFGTTPALEARFGELRQSSGTRPPEAAVPVRRPLRTRVEAGPSPEAASPAPLTDYDLERLLATNGWDLMDIEWLLVDALEDL